MNTISIAEFRTLLSAPTRKWVLDSEGNVCLVHSQQITPVYRVAQFDNLK